MEGQSRQGLGGWFGPLGSNETIYIGGVFEKDDTSTRSYYAFGGQVVAYRLQEGTTDERYYLVSDHLGTNSHQLTYNTGADRSSQYYYPFGGDRAGAGLDTDRGYTGQVSDAALTGLLFYNARYYDPGTTPVRLRRHHHPQPR